MSTSFYENVFFLFYWVCAHVFIFLPVLIVQIRNRLQCLAKGVTSTSLMLKKVRGCLGSTEPSAFYRVCVAPPPAAYKSCQKAAPIGSTSDLFLLLLALLTTRSELSWYLLICIVLLIAVVSFLDIYRFVLSVYLLLLSLQLAVNQTTSKDILDS